MGGGEEGIKEWKDEKIANLISESLMATGEDFKKL